MTILARRIFLRSLSVLLIASSARCDLHYSDRSVSPSGQFIIYGGDAGFRGSVSALAERTKANLLSLLKQRDRWKIAIVVNVQLRSVNLPERPATELRFSKTEAGLKLQLDLTLSEKMQAAAIEREIMRVILEEMIYRDQTGISPGDVFVEPPAWMVDGLLESGPNPNRTSLADSLSTPVGLPTMAEFLNRHPETLDSTGRQLYRAYSFVLVQALIGGPGGASCLSHYIEKLAIASNDPLVDLRASFPEIPDFDGALKSKVAELRTSFDRDLLTFPQSEKRLNELLASSLWKEHDRPITIENAARPRLGATQRSALQEFSRKLLLLATKANPVLRPAIQGYQQIAEQLVLGRTGGVEKRLAELRSLRAQLSVRMNELNDYLNWFEAAKMETPSGLFEDSLETAAPESFKPKRRDPLSIYLDAVELEF